MDALPNRIRELRNARGWRLEDLAERVGCGVTQISDLERGGRELSFPWMQRIARALGPKVKPADLLNEADNSRSLDPAERELVDLYGLAGEEQRAQLLQMARILVTGSNQAVQAPKPGPKRHAA